MLRWAVLCVILVSAWARKLCYDMGTAGTICDKRYCPAEEAVCVRKECTCVSGRGQPEMQCSNSEDFFASVLEDSKAWSINHREEAEVPVPCQYLFSHVKTKMHSVYSPNGKCDIRVNLNNQRIRGKTFVGGFEISVKCTDMLPMIGENGMQDHVYRADAYVNEDGKYCFNLQASIDGGKHFSDNFDDRTYWINLQLYHFSVDPTTNRVQLQIPPAGVTAQLRPFDPQYDVLNQKWLPGFTVKYDADKDVTFHSKDQVVSLAPGQTLEEVSDLPGTDELTLRALTGPGNKKASYPNYSDKCLAAKDALEECTPGNGRTDALEQCRFILAKPTFVNCYGPPDSGNVDDIMELYALCVQSFCAQDNNQACDGVKTAFDNMDPSCRAEVPQEKMGC